MTIVALSMRKLGDPRIAQLVMGQSPASETYNTFGRGLPFYQGKADFGLLYPRARVWCSAPLRIAERNDTLVSVRAPVGDVNLSEERCCLGRGVAAIRAAESVNSIFLYFAMASAKERLASVSTGTTFESINKTALEDLEIPFPSLEEQKRIAALLWKVQRAIEVEEKLIATARELKQAAMRQLFTHGLRGETLKETEVGEVPDSWNVCSIRTNAKLIAGGTPQRGESQFWNEGTIPWVKTGEVNYCLITDTEEKITQSGLDNSAAKLLPSDTILVAMYGQGITRGKVAILGIEAATNQACVGLIPKNDNVVPKYLYYYLTYSYERLRSLSHGAQQQNLNAELVGSFQVAFPDRDERPEKDEQLEIVRMLSTIDQKIAIHEQKHRTFRELFQTLLHKLMTGEIRVADLDIDVSEVTQ